MAGSRFRLPSSHGTELAGIANTANTRSTARHRCALGRCHRAMPCRVPAAMHSRPPSRSATAWPEPAPSWSTGT